MVGLRIFICTTNSIVDNVDSVHHSSPTCKQQSHRADSAVEIEYMLISFEISVLASRFNQLLHHFGVCLKERIIRNAEPKAGYLLLNPFNPVLEIVYVSPAHLSGSGINRPDQTRYLAEPSRYIGSEFVGIEALDSFRRDQAYLNLSRLPSFPHDQVSKKART